MPASDDLTPEVLARIEADVSTVETTSPGWTFATNRLLKGAVPALLSGVRSRDARIAKLEAVISAAYTVAMMESGKSVARFLHEHVDGATNG